jgi:hypothetical protein
MELGTEGGLGLGERGRAEMMICLVTAAEPRTGEIREGAAYYRRSGDF